MNTLKRIARESGMSITKTAERAIETLAGQSASTSSTMLVSEEIIEIKARLDALEGRTSIEEPNSIPQEPQPTQEITSPVKPAQDNERRDEIIIECRKQGLGYSAIQEELKRNGFISPSGNVISLSVINRVLKKAGL
jgi:hypothetical protein